MTLFRGGLALTALLALLPGLAEAEIPQPSQPRKAPRRKEAPPARVPDLRFPGHEPSARSGRAGELHMVFVREEGNKQRLYYARGGSKPAGPIAITAASEQVESRGEMGPSLEILPNGTLVAVYAVAMPGEHASELRAQRSSDGGATWEEPSVVHDDGKPGSHGFSSTSLDSSGELLVAWLDGRSGQQGVEYSWSRDGGRFAPNKTVNPRTCQCCVTAIAGGPSRSFWIAYRGLTGKDLRNIEIVRGEASLGALGTPVTVSDDGWHIDGCPDSGPRMAVEADGTLWITWFNGAAPGVFAARSTDGGRTFAPRIPIAPPPGEKDLANYPDVAVLPDGRVVLVYESRSTIFGRLLSRDGETWGPPVKLVQGATHARIVPGKASALSFTAREGSGTAAVVSPDAMAPLTGPPTASPSGRPKP